MPFVRRIKLRYLSALGLIVTAIIINSHRRIISSFKAGQYDNLDVFIRRQEVANRGEGGKGIEKDIVVIPTKDDDEVDLVHKGILSEKPVSFFRVLQAEIDNADPSVRCEQYDFGHRNQSVPVSSEKTRQRRIFYGSLIADESWELLDIVAAETHGIFYAMVFVESNRTQNFQPRPFRRQTPRFRQRIQDMFGTDHVQVRSFVNEDRKLKDLKREHAQREEIIKGWKQLGMTEDDVGYIADVDETFTRDFLRAVQQCPYIEFLDDYDTHRCFNPKTKITGIGRVFESSPECAIERRWQHPNMVVGACIEGIGNETLHPLAPRDPANNRLPGYAQKCHDPKNGYANIVDNKYPLWNTHDFRSTCGGRQFTLQKKNHSPYTAFHFHNFFPDSKAIRNKYRTYGHPVKEAWTIPLQNISRDLDVMVRCALQHEENQQQPSAVNFFVKGKRRESWEFVKRGVRGTLPPWPIFSRF